MTVVVFPHAHRRGGVERIAGDYCRHLASVGDRPVFVGESFDGAAEAGVEVRTVPPSRPGPLHPFRFRRAAQTVLDGLSAGPVLTLGANCPPGDVLYVQSVHRAYLRSVRRIPVRGVEVPGRVRYLQPKHQLLLAVEKSYFTSPRPRAVVCCSAREQQDVVELYGVDEARTHVVPNGYDPAVFHPGRAADRAATRHRLGVQDGQVSLLLMANELHRKGFGPLVEAVARLQDDRVRVDVVGRTGLDAYAARIRALGLADRVHWHGATADAAAFYAAADLLVLPTQYEPFGMVVVEALACGLPVVTTRLAGAAAAVEPGVNGLLQTDPWDVEELASLLADAVRPGVLKN